MILVHVGKFAKVENNPAGRGEAVFLLIGFEQDAFIGGDMASKGESDGGTDGIWLDGDLCGEVFSHAHHEFVVHESESLEGGGGFTPSVDV